MRERFEGSARASTTNPPNPQNSPIRETRTLHVAVDERTSQAASQSRPIAAGKHALRCLGDQQVKECVVRRGNGPAKACLRRAPGFLEGKLSGLAQQVCVQAHGGLDRFGSVAKSHVDP